MYEETDKLDESLEDYKKILELDPGNKDALGAVMVSVQFSCLCDLRNHYNFCFSFSDYQIKSTKKMRS